ncbi:hypothetical protein Patl1_03025 [Pistacia atlantica]|uniref:Uncharacterized protein n=1 Tax=Pistacia atlantica TaxID=434234 RepID=A0ACC1C7E6_9ROSI|nr:hypothetical protein Patl1_03025 [Pistacia atlantica]
MKLPDNGHAIQLGQDGKINQTFIANGDNMNYLLTFILVLGVENCSANADALMFGPESLDSGGVFSLNLTNQSDANSICWPVIDMPLLKTVETLVKAIGKYTDNLLLNGGFEAGSDFLSDSIEGILLESERNSDQSALLNWTVIGTVKYINSMHFFVHKDNATIELVSGVSTGIQIDVMLTEGSSYYLDFTVGDERDGCEGKLIVRVQAGQLSKILPFTVGDAIDGCDGKLMIRVQAGPVV